MTMEDGNDGREESPERDRLAAEQFLAAPSVQRAVESIRALTSEVRLWFLPPGGDRRPILAGDETTCSEFDRLSEAERKRILEEDRALCDCPGESPVIRECCPGRSRALYPIRFGSRLLGTVGACGVDEAKARHAGRIAAETLRLVSNLLEDHDDLELIHRVWDEMGAVSEISPVVQLSLIHI